MMLIVAPLGQELTQLITLLSPSSRHPSPLVVVCGFSYSFISFAAGKVAKGATPEKLVCFL